MQQDTASFWSDIKTLDARLAENPDSLCFAQLSDVYLKVGLADDALHLARQGVARHPRYVSGQRSLARACHAKGMQEECCTALEYVTSSMPEDVESQKMLARIYLQGGNTEAARNCLKTALEFAPEESECLIQLAALQTNEPFSQQLNESSVLPEEDEEVEELEDADILEIDDLDIIEEDVSDEGSGSTAVNEQPDTGLRGHTPAEHIDPLSTATLAELYVTQGFIEKALVIYRALQTDNPDNHDIAARIHELETPVNEVSAPPAITITEATISEQPPTLAASTPVSGSADNRITVLTGWLENIRRVKSCR